MCFYAWLDFGGIDFFCGNPSAPRHTVAESPTAPFHTNKYKYPHTDKKFSLNALQWLFTCNITSIGFVTYQLGSTPLPRICHNVSCMGKEY